MKVNTDFGVQEIKPRRLFEWNGFKFAIVYIPEKYMGTKEPLIIQRVIEYKTTQALPITINKVDTLKAIEHKAINALSRYEGNLQEFEDRLNSYEHFN